ncbi:fluoride efflux transporter FluC [Streptomyces ficellus]|uniref:Fluoride-specific ion channel FluC n=1 Tax=Streptomyces ficellus TaxID=1977088 RepID=A0A6I6F9J1_9ACTN|nr:CrcB family protein [Streptomyces ficellus]QGV76892.1 CrcB family protein [Streptomyces ficellus]
MNWLMVIAGALVGAPLRYLTDRLVQARYGTVLPWGTIAVNTAACTLLGFLTGAVAATTVPGLVHEFIGPGLCASLSTYSTFSYETVRLTETGAKPLAAANVLISVLAGLAAAFAGHALAGALLA